MNLTKIIFAVVFIACCCLLQSYALKCFVCEGKQNCLKPPLLICNQALANNTRQYLAKYHVGTFANTTSNQFACLKESLNFTNGIESYYKGCIYSNISACNLNFVPGYVLKTKQCKQCTKDGCNPAGRISSDLITVITSVIAAVILRLAWKQM